MPCPPEGRRFLRGPPPGLHHAGPTPRGAPRAQLLLRSPVVGARRLNAWMVGGLSALGGFLGLVASVAVGSALAAVAPAAVGVVAATGLVCGARLTLSGSRKLHRYALVRGAKALEGAALTVATRAECGWGFLPPGGG